MKDKDKPGVIPDTHNKPAPTQSRPGQQPVDRTVFRTGSTQVDPRRAQGNSAPANNSSGNNTPGNQTPGNQNQPNADKTNIGRPRTPDTTNVAPRRPTPADATNVAPRRPARADTTRIKQPVSTHGGARQEQPDRTRMRASAPLGSKDRQASTPAFTPSTPGAEQRQVLKGRFILDKVIGVGGMGVVYKATDRLKIEAKDREPYVAIKVLSEEFKSHPESFIALQRESRKTQRIAHPNVVKVYDFDRDGDIVFMTMEYMEGRPLDQLIKQYSATGLPRDEVWLIMNGLCSALMHAHNENIVHSDFKPGNIFITEDSTPKIFDFGIARAVASFDRLSSGGQDRTVFDAGSLGALTPAYASMEMLLGQEPDVRDDLYALGCIAYEMLTGEHPFNRMPADEAARNRLKPRKISGIKKRQWRAIEKALAFKREDRISSVEEFYSLIQPKAKSSSILLATVLIISAIAVATYFIVNRTSSSSGQTGIEAGALEFKIRYDLFKEKIDKLIGEATFTAGWEQSIWDEVTGMTNLLGDKPDDWLNLARNKIYEMYVEKIRLAKNATKYDAAMALLNNAYRYTTDTRFLDAEKIKIAELIKQEALRQKALAEKNKRRVTTNDIKTKEEQKRFDLFQLALKNVNQQLRCDGKLNMRDFGIAINKLRSLYPDRYAKMENNIIVTLADCILKTGKSQPERATEAKKYALRIFNNNALIASIKIEARDVCDKSIAGLGARGERSVCKDKLTNGGIGPAMVVIPAGGSLPLFAMGKYEITVKEINEYCLATKKCSPLPSRDDTLPASNISIRVASGYVGWLSKLTRQRYRLPTHAEWKRAASSTNRSHDPNRNCELSSRGIEKGGQLVRATAGKQNNWGLVNYLGNVREWVYDENRNLIAVGGSSSDSMSQCKVTSSVQHSGTADAQTGFRVLREIKNR